MTSWSEFLHYDCEDCGEKCINHEDTDHAQLGKCRGCHIDDLVEDYEQQLRNQNSTNTTSDRPEGAAPSHGGPTDAGSARPQAKRRGHSSGGRGSGLVSEDSVDSDTF